MNASSNDLCAKWVARYRRAGECGLRDRSSAPRRQARQTALRRAGRRRSSRCGGCGSPGRRSPSCSGCRCRRCRRSSRVIGMGKLGRLGLEPAQRYERQRPGELVHIDVKKLGRIEGGAGKRVTGGVTRTTSPRRPDPDGIDRCISRLGLRPHRDRRLQPPGLRRGAAPTRKPQRRSRFLRRAIAFFARHGITVERVLTDNGSPYRLHDPRDRLPHARHPPPRAPAPTARRPTAKPNASSARCSTAGPTARSTAQAENAPQHLTAGSGTTTIAANTQPSATSRPSHD